MANPLLVEADKLSKAGDHAGAIKLYDKLIEGNPKKNTFYAFRGEEKAKNGDMDGAIADFDKADQLSPSELPFGTMFQARTLNEMGKKEEALKLLEKKMEENPKRAQYIMGAYEMLKQETK